MGYDNIIRDKMGRTMKQVKQLSDSMLKVMREDPNAICWYHISFKYQLTMELIEEFEIYINFSELVESQILPEPILDRWMRRFDGEILAKKQVLSEDFMRKNVDDLEWSEIIRYQELSKEFITEMQLKGYL